MHSIVPPSLLCLNSCVTSFNGVDESLNQLNADPLQFFIWRPNRLLPQTVNNDTDVDVKPWRIVCLTLKAASFKCLQYETVTSSSPMSRFLNALLTRHVENVFETGYVFLRRYSSSFLLSSV